MKGTYRISAGYGGVKVQRDSDQEALAHARRVAERRGVKRFVVHRLDPGEGYVKIHPKQEAS
jgi:hypothetical protein